MSTPNTLKEFSKKIPGKANIIVALIISMLVWFVLPHISIGSNYPFTSTTAKLLIIGLALVIWALKFLLIQIQKHQINLIPIAIINSKRCWTIFKNESSRVIYNTQNYAKELKTRAKHDKDKRRLRKLPWYVLLGSPKSGRKSLISNLGLYFAQAKHFGMEAENYIKQFPDYDWWFSEQAVIIDVMSHIKESESHAWKRFIKLLKKERKNKPINGIILTFSMAEVLLYSNQQRQEFIQDICLYLREIHLNFASQVPVYLVFTKIDLVEGFMEFFNDLSKDELRQVWGMAFPMAISDDANQVLQFFHQEYSAIIEKLRSKVLWSLDTERSPRGRELIHGFPQQMQLLRRPIETFISELFSGIRFQKALQLRGLFFCSSKQEGEPFDFLLQAMSKKFQLVPPVVQRPHRMGECYFLRRLFHEVIYPEAKILGDSERSRKIRKFTYHSFRITAPLFLLLIVILMHEGYYENLENIAMAENNVALFNQLEFSMNPARDSLNNILPSLDQLDSINRSYQDNEPLGMRFLFATSSIRNHADNAMQRVLSNLYLPRVAARLETNLNQTIADQNLLYATLKAYLSFDSDSNTVQEAIEAPMQYNWMRDFNSSPETIKKLDYYLNIALQQPVTKLPLDEALINRIRDQLESIIPSQRAYGLLELKSSLSDLPNLAINTSIGQHFYEIFKTEKSELIVPALYTTNGFHKLFLKLYIPIAEEVAQDNRDIGLSNADYETQTVDQITSAMEDEYNAYYDKHWQHVLNQIHIKPFTNLRMAIGSLQVLISPQSPMSNLFSLIDQNTNPVSKENVHVANDFKTINQFQTSASGASWQNTQKILNNLQSYLITIQNSTDIKQAEYNAVLNTIKSGKSPIIDLTLVANKSPEPIKRWLNTIANHSWNVLIMGAHNYVNTLWQTDIMPTYTANLQGRYPIDPHGHTDIAIDDFNQFFSPNAKLSKFFNSYIKPFIKTDQQIWTLYQVQGHDFQMSSQNIALFQTAMAIQNDYFSNGSDAASLSFSIKPMTLDVNSSSVSLVIGNHDINYSHGPQDTTSLNWPSINNQQAHIIISGFNGGQFSRKASGPWALFKLLDQGEFINQQTGDYQFSITINGHHASYEFFGSGIQGIYQLTSLKYFNLPHNIAENK